MNEEETIRIGTQVLYRAAFGKGEQVSALVKGIEETEFTREKYGEEVLSVAIDAHYVLILDNGHWCYSDQVDGIVKQRNK